ncbi:glycerol dehydratase reactivase beta/small subunit family protein (plasmid) [Haloferacaceae archaeon DSL9]
MSGCRGPIRKNDEVPRIFLWYLGSQEPEWICDVEHGLEEEGVSWTLQSVDTVDCVATAYQAAVRSTLKIGLCATIDGRLVLHHKQLPRDQPLFDISEVRSDTARQLGANAARLAKGTSLKELG